MAILRRRSRLSQLTSTLYRGFIDPSNFSGIAVLMIPEEYPCPVIYVVCVPAAEGDDRARKYGMWHPRLRIL